MPLRVATRLVEAFISRFDVDVGGVDPRTGLSRFQIGWAVAWGSWFGPAVASSWCAAEPPAGW